MVQVTKVNKDVFIFVSPKVLDVSLPPCCSAGVRRLPGP
jgi:hypothetical protein